MAVLDHFFWKAGFLAVLAGFLPMLFWSTASSDSSFVGAIRQSLTGWQSERESPEMSFYILSYEPLMIYMTNFITKSEREYLITLAETRYERSQSTLHDGSLGIGEYRTSSSAPLPFRDPVVQAITRRAADMQGFMPPTDFEAFQVVRYGPGQKFDPHYDWYHNPEEQNNTARITSIFATLQANCSNCGTQFPHLRYDWAAEDPRLCEIVDCSSKALTVKPIEGNALFWRNLLANGTGDERNLHAGLPLASGSKIGLNIFARTTVG